MKSLPAQIKKIVFGANPRQSSGYPQAGDMMAKVCDISANEYLNPSSSLHTWPDLEQLLSQGCWYIPWSGLHSEVDLILLRQYKGSAHWWRQWPLKPGAIERHDVNNESITNLGDFLGDQYPKLRMLYVTVKH